MQIVLDDSALRDLDAIKAWISEDSPGAAKLVIKRLLDQIELLGTFPMLGHPLKRKTFRELVVPRLPYVIIYDVDYKLDRILITAVIHMARDRSDLR